MRSRVQHHALDFEWGDLLQQGAVLGIAKPNPFRDWFGTKFGQHYSTKILAKMPVNTH